MLPQETHASQADERGPFLSIFSVTVSRKVLLRLCTDLLQCYQQRKKTVRLH